MENGQLTAPGHAPVGLSRRLFHWCARDAEVFQLTFAARQSATDFAQPVRPSELARWNGDKLAATGGAVSLIIASVVGDNLVELLPGEEL